jgi:hypothetical protein
MNSKGSLMTMRTPAYDHQLYAAAEPRFAFTARTVEQARAWQQAFSSELFRALGLDVMQQTLASLEPRALRQESVTVADHVRERWTLEVEPGLALPFYLLKPLCIDGLLPLVLTPHGHNPPHLYVGLHDSEDERRHIEEGDRDIAVQAVRQGYLVIAPTVRGFGDTRTAQDIEKKNVSSCRVQTLHGLLVGRTAIGERVWDMQRLLDWALATLPVDHRRIAITGNSGGGTVSLFTGAIDARFGVVMPGSYFCTFADSLGSIYHCDCNYVPGILRLGEMHEVAGLIAPRAFLAINGVEDAIFPIRATRRAFTGLREIYRVFGAVDRCGLYEGLGGHRYYAAGAWPFLRHQFSTGEL